MEGVGTSGPSDERTDCPDGAEKWLSPRKETGGGGVFCAGAKAPKTLSKSLCGPCAKPEGDMALSGAGDLRKKGFVDWLVVDAAGLPTAGVECCCGGLLGGSSAALLNSSISPLILSRSPSLVVSCFLLIETIPFCCRASVRIFSS